MEFTVQEIIHIINGLNFIITWQTDMQEKIAIERLVKKLKNAIVGKTIIKKVKKDVK